MRAKDATMSAKMTVKAATMRVKDATMSAWTRP